MGIFSRLFKKKEKVVSKVEVFIPKKVEKYPMGGVICIDTETTGLTEKDEILSLAIMDLEGNILFNEYLKPEIRKRWPKAQEIHGITPSMVKDKKRLLDYKKEIETILYSAEMVIGYNLEFDLEMLQNNGIYTHKIKRKFDVMREYCYLKNQTRWSKLTTVAKRYKYTYNAHDALEDVKATIHCYKCMAKEEGK